MCNNPKLHHAKMNAYIKFREILPIGSQDVERKQNFGVKDLKMSNNTGTTHYDSLQESYWADLTDSHNEVIMTSLQGQ